MTHEHHCLPRFYRFLQNNFAYNRQCNGSNACRVGHMGVKWVVEVGHEEKKRCKIDTASAGLARDSPCLGTCDRRFSNRADL